ncbi:hypothetical protein [Singulisphaera sp. PoT]|uniref:hypothetical protein n=1 Tax=Singulisphaera sp. PoT TaxID=3411797 RepID=UPI003BF5EFFC
MLLLLVAATSMFSGCGGTPEGQVPVYPVSGQIQYQGKPLSGAVVTFHPEDESKVAKDTPRPMGRTDEQGKFELTTYGLSDGAPAGSYLVAISTLPPPRTETGLFASKSPLAVDTLKGRFLDHKKAGLKAEVKEVTNQIPAFDLK